MYVEWWRRDLLRGKRVEIKSYALGEYFYWIPHIFLITFTFHFERVLISDLIALHIVIIVAIVKLANNAQRNKVNDLD